MDTRELVEPELWQEDIHTWDEDRCHLCHVLFSSAIRPTRDHIVPTSRGGEDIRKNVVLTCGPCNSEKSNKFPWCGCNICRKSVRYHWEKYGISATHVGSGWQVKPKPRFY